MTANGLKSASPNSLLATTLTHSGVTVISGQKGQGRMIELRIDLDWGHTENEEPTND